MKRKTDQLSPGAQPPGKKHKATQRKQTKAQHSPVLDSCYQSVVTVRQYLIERLPVKCSRRKHLNASIGDEADAILNEWRVGVLITPTPEIQRVRSLDLAAFTQTQRSVNVNTGRTPTCTLDEVLDFAVWHLFNKANKCSNQPRNLLCNGLQRGVAPDGSMVVPGIVQLHPCDNLTLFKSVGWQKIFAALGADGESILTSLLLDCGVFSNLASNSHNHYQVSGVPIASLQAQQTLSVTSKLDRVRERPPSTISFVRNRMLYAKPSLNTQGHVRFGLKHIHVLQRCSDLADDGQTIHIIKHMFPRQFGLHNVFTSEVDKRHTSQPFLDYLYREEEIGSADKHPKRWLPRRLRGAVLRLVQNIRRRHSRCSYTQLLRHYISLQTTSGIAQKLPGDNLRTPSSGFITQSPLRNSAKNISRSYQATGESNRSFLAHATPTPRVSAFCRAVLCSVLPKDAFGEGDDGHHNWSVMLHNVEAFIKGRRFETMSLEQVCQRLRLGCVAWLVPENMPKQQKMSQKEREKRLEVFREFVYYIFDSLVIPLIQSNFYVTESGPLRNRLFYFRHDIWRKLAEPSLAMVRSGIYQPLSSAEVRRLFSSRSMGYSHVRLLPKDEGTRTITNLRRRMTRIINGKRMLLPSINTQLAPVYSTLSFERRRHPTRLGGAIFSVGGLHDRLKRFKDIIGPSAKLYFAKVDVQSCFDSIPQKQLITMVQAVFQCSAYRTSKYIEVKPAGVTQTRRRFLNVARVADSEPVFSMNVADDLVMEKGARVLAEVGTQKVLQHRQLQELLRDHVQNNVVKIGKKHYRQTEGIAQGSVLSSLLCSFFYSAFEQDQLSFLNPQNRMLVRLIDDFLLITTDKRTARTFLQIMTQPHEQYGITVNPKKSLANFEVTVGAHKIPRHQSTDDFPYCGLTIDMKCLEIGRDRQRKDPILSNGLTVDLTKKAGSTFLRKVRLSFTQQMSRMLLDMPLNSPKRVLRTLTEAYSEAIMKTHAYLQCMSRRQRPRQQMLIQLVDDLVQLGSRYITQPTTIGSAAIALTRQHVIWALADAIERVLGTKQSRYRHLMRYVKTMRSQSAAVMAMDKRALHEVRRHRDAMIRESVY